MDPQQQPAATGLLLWARLAGDIDRLQQQRRANAGSTTLRYDTRCYFNVRSKADTSRLNVPHGTDK